MMRVTGPRNMVACINGKQNRKAGEVFSDVPDRNMTCYVSDKGAYHHSLLVAVQPVLTRVQLNDLNQSSGLLHSDAGRRIIQTVPHRCEMFVMIVWRRSESRRRSRQRPREGQWEDRFHRLL